MKRLLVLLLVCGSAFGAGTVQQSITQLGQTGNWVVAFQWTGDASTGSVPVTAAIGAINQLNGYLITAVETAPSLPAPSAGYSVAIKDPAGFDILAGAAASLSATIPEAFAASNAAPPLQGTITLVLTGNAVAGARGAVFVFLSKPTTLNASNSRFSISGGAAQAHKWVKSITPNGLVALTQPSWIDLAKTPSLLVSEYTFSQLPGTSLTGGVQATVAMAPCPLGVNGTDTAHYLYLSGGTGSAEPVLLTGGTCVSGALTGTVIFTPAGSHSGAWAIGSATGGVAEALFSAGTVTATVKIATPVTVYAPISAPTTCSSAVTIEGNGISNGPIITRASTFLSGDIFKNAGTACSWTLRAMTISQNGGIVQDGAAITFDHPSAAQFVEDVAIFNGQYGIRAIGTPFLNITRSSYTQLENGPTNRPIAGLEIADGSINTFVTNSAFGATSTATVNMLLYGIYIHSTLTGPVDGVWVENTGFSATTCINMIVGGSFLVNIMFNGGICDGAAEFGILIGGNLGLGAAAQFNNMHIDLQALNGWAAAGNAVDIGVASPTTFDNIQFNGGYISGTDHADGVSIGRTGAKLIAFNGVQIRDSNRSNTGGVAGISAADGVTGLRVTGCNFYNISSGHQKFAIKSLGTLEATIVGNTLTGETAPINLAGAFTGTIGDNRGLNDGLAFASLPANPPNGMTIYCTDCNSGCTAGASAGRQCVREAGAWTH